MLFSIHHKDHSKVLSKGFVPVHTPANWSTLLTEEQGGNTGFHNLFYNEDLISDVKIYRHANGTREIT